MSRIVGQMVKKRSIEIFGHRTSLSLEEAFWRALKHAASGEDLSINALVEQIDRERRGNLSSAVRVYLLERLEHEAAPGRSGGTVPPKPEA